MQFRVVGIIVETEMKLYELLRLKKYQLVSVYGLRTALSTGYLLTIFGVQ